MENPEQLTPAPESLPPNSKWNYTFSPVTVQMNFLPTLIMGILCIILLFGWQRAEKRYRLLLGANR